MDDEERASYSAAIDAFIEAQHTGEVHAPVLEALSSFGNDRLLDGLDLQLEALRRLQGSGERLGGWKIGLTSRAMRDSMGEGFRPFGYLLESRMFSSPAEIHRPAGQVSIETEIGVVMGCRLAGEEVTPQEARDAVAAVVPALEINQRRLLSEVPRPIRLADDLTQWGTVFSEPASFDVDFLALDVELFCNGALVATGSSGPEILDDPFVSLARVCRLLSQFGLGIEAGQRLITGSLIAPAPVEGAGKWEARFGELGSLFLTFED